MIVPYDFTPMLGGNKSKQLSTELIRNMYMLKSESNGRVSVHDFPGLKLITSGSGIDRGHHVMSGIRYVINGTTLFKEDSSGIRTTMGTIAGADRAIFADDGSTMGIVASNILYSCDGNSVSTVTQTVITSPSWITYINSQFIIGGDDQQFATSDPGDITTWNALNFASAEVDGDDLIRGYVFNQLVYLFGSDSTEAWYNSGVGNPPFDRQDTSLISTGIAGKYAVANTDKFFYWLGDDRKVYQGVGASARTVNTSGVSHIISGYGSVSDCIVSAFIIGGQDFVLFKFPSAGDALVYSETNNYWITLSSGTDPAARASWYGNSISWVYDRNIVTDEFDGNTYELDSDTYTDNGKTRLRVAILPVITGAVIGKHQNMITLSSLHIPMQTGVGLATGQGSDPELMCAISGEGGEVYDHETLVSIGVMGDYGRKVMFYDFVSGYEIVPRIMCSDPVPLTFYSGGSVDVMDAGY